MKGSLCSVCVLSGLFLLVTACGIGGPSAPPSDPTSPASSQDTAVPAAAPSQVVPPTKEAEKQAPWARVRAVLPPSVGVYSPRSLPARFGPPELVEVEAVAENTPSYTIPPRYTVVYKAEEELVAFIMGMGAGALGNAPSEGRREAISVLGQEGTLHTNAQLSRPYFGAFWEQGGQHYDVIAISARMTIQEFRQIIDGLEEVR